MKIFDRLAVIFLKVAFKFEFFFPKVISYFIGQKLKKSKQKGWLEDFKVNSKRKGK